MLSSFCNCSLKANTEFEFAYLYCNVLYCVHSGVIPTPHMIMKLTFFFFSNNMAAFHAQCLMGGRFLQQYPSHRVFQSPIVRPGTTFNLFGAIFHFFHSQPFHRCVSCLCSCIFPGTMEEETVDRVSDPMQREASR